VWRAEHRYVLVVGARSIDCAEFARGGRDAARAIRAVTQPIELDGEAVAPATAMRRSIEAAVRALVPQHGVTRHPGRLAVLVADAWLAIATIPWSPDLTRAKAAQAYVRNQLTAAGFDVTFGDTVRWDDEAPYGQPRLAVAYPALLFEALRNSAQALGTRLVSVRPLSVAAAELVRRRVDAQVEAVGIVAGDTLSLLQVQSGHLTMAGQAHHGLGPAERTARVRTLWRRQQLRYPASARIAPLHVLNLDREPLGGEGGQDDDSLSLVEWPGPASTLEPAALGVAEEAPEASPLDALVVTRGGSVGWVLAGALMVLAVAMTVNANRLAAMARVQETELVSRTSALDPPVPAALTREESRRARAVNAAIRELNLPIGAVLRALTPPRDIRIALLGIDVDHREIGEGPADEPISTLKLTVESPTGAEMARYVAYLAGRTPLSAVYLVRHEIDEKNPTQPYRFIAEVAWSD
jgi:hypothetical protein